MKTPFKRLIASILTCSFILTILFIAGPSSAFAVGTEPSLEVSIEASPQSLEIGPDTISYVFKITNTGNKALADIIILNDTCNPVAYTSGDTNGNTLLDLSETWLYSCSEIISKTQTSTVVATGWDNHLKFSDTAQVTVNVQNPGIAPIIHVTINTSSVKFIDKGTLVTYTERISNPGNADLKNIRIYDDECSPMEYTSGDVNFDSRIDMSETWVFSCQAYLTKTTTNTVTVNGEANGLFVEAKDSATITVRGNRIITDTEIYDIPTTTQTPTSNSNTPFIPRLPAAGIAPQNNRQLIN